MLSEFNFSWRVLVSYGLEQYILVVNLYYDNSTQKLVYCCSVMHALWFFVAELWMHEVDFGSFIQRFSSRGPQNGCHNTKSWRSPSRAASYKIPRRMRTDGQGLWYHFSGVIKYYLIACLACHWLAKTFQAFIHAMSCSKSSVNESHIHAQLECSAKLHGAQMLAFPPVVAGGPRFEHCHYHNSLF